MHVDLDLLYATTLVAGFSIAGVSFLLSLTQRGTESAGRVLALFFLILALSELSSVVELVVGMMPALLRDTLRMFSFVINFAIAPLFLLYVRLLIGSNDVATETLHRGHLVLPGLAAACAAAFLALPTDLREELYSGALFATLPMASKVIVIGLIGVEFLIYVQWLTYTFWVYREQRHHLDKLRRQFESTEGLERQWINVLASVLALYAGLCLVGFTLSTMGLPAPASRELNSVCVLVLVIILAIWGLRPRVGLSNNPQLVPVLHGQTRSKYEKSALTPEQAERIARKIHAAMHSDRLYRDPNLTLSALSKHVGVSSNYVSQTLNERVGQSFFEFVNGWRVDEAIPLLRGGEDTVLAIAFEVGFNSRSSFYTAFKKKTGLTPSAFKMQQAASREVRP